MLLVNIPRLAGDREIISKWKVAHYLLLEHHRQKKTTHLRQVSYTKLYNSKMQKQGLM